MSLVVNNAFRFPLTQQRRVNDTVCANVTAITKKLADVNAERLTHHIFSLPKDEWLPEMERHMEPSMPPLSDSRKRMILSRKDANRAARAYLCEYHRWVQAFPSTYPLYDTVTTWGYTWDANGEYGYLTLYPASGPPRAEIIDIIDGLDDVLEPFSYDGRTGETDHPTLDADTVKDTWDRLAGNGSIADCGVTGQLSVYALNTAFGLW